MRSPLKCKRGNRFMFTVKEVVFECKGAGQPTQGYHCDDGNTHPDRSQAKYFLPLFEAAIKELKELAQ